MTTASQISTERSHPPQAAASPHAALVSFIIPALNEETQIAQTLEALRRMQIPTCVRGMEIIVVDNSSIDRTAQLARDQGAIVVQVPAKSPSHARNAGARAAGGEWLAFVDADCRLAPNWLTVCGGELADDPRNVAAAAVMEMLGADRTWVERAAAQLAGGGRGSVPMAVGWLPTANLLVRRAAFDAVGGFDESLTTCEDCDLGYKLAKLGRQIVDGRATFDHRGESRTLGEVFCREAWRSHGNLRLAMSRPFDWKNWLSLLVPVVIVFGFVATLVCLFAAAIVNSASWPFIAALAIFPLAAFALQLRKAGFSSPKSAPPTVRRPDNSFCRPRRRPVLVLPPCRPLKRSCKRRNITRRRPTRDTPARPACRWCFTRA